MHRSQGATVERAHVLANGGGRELACVALSRAREHTGIYAAADNLEQAVDDLHADWSQARHQRWITDTPAEPGREPEPEQRPRAVDTPDAAASPGERKSAARHHIAALDDDYRNLLAGSGQWHNTPEGTAARNQRDARDHLDQARRDAQDPNSRRKDRRAASNALPELETAATRAEREWNKIGEPTAEQLQADIRDAHREINRVDADYITQRLDHLQQPSASRSVEYDIGISL